MTTPGARGQPPFDALAQEAIAATRGHRRQYATPPDWDAALGYEPARLTDEERAEAEKAKQERDRVCRLCGAVHVLPNTAACPRLASFELDGEGHVKAGTFRTDNRWHKGRAVFAEDLHESKDGDGDGGK